MKVKDCMCGDVCCVKTDTKVSDIAKMMNQNHVGCVPVCDEKNSLVGIITDRDIILGSVTWGDSFINIRINKFITNDEFLYR